MIGPEPIRFGEVVLLVCAILWAVCISAAAICEGQEGIREVLPAGQWTPEAHHRLAKAMVGEGGLRSHADWAMVAHVLARRWYLVGPRNGWTFAELTQRYTMLKNDTPWSRKINALPWGPVPEWPGWEQALVFAWRWQQGWVPDPCPEADHWHGRVPTRKAIENVKRGQWRRLECGTLHNVPYAEE